MIVIDGSLFEGGGQMVRTALALSTVSRQPVRVENIRAHRPQGGLKLQHVKCVEVLEKLCNAVTSGVRVGATAMEFVPGPIRARTIDVDMETAGSVTLLLQSVLLPLACADRACTVRLRGGTNGAWAMPVEYVQQVLVPNIRQFFDRIEVRVLKRGYYPKGGGLVEVSVRPLDALARASRWSEVLRACADFRMDLSVRPQLQVVKGLVHASSGLEGARVCERAVEAAKKVLAPLGVQVSVDVEYSQTLSEGMGVTLWAVFQDASEALPDAVIGGDALGEKGVPAQDVGARAAEHLLRHVREGALVDPHVADNLVPFLALCGGRVMAGPVTEHTRANMYVCERLLKTKFVVNGGVVLVETGELEVVF